VAKLTVRLSDDLLADAKREAALRELSLNGWVMAVIRAAVDPDSEDDERSRVREKLRKAGILAEIPRMHVDRPDPKVLQAADTRITRGKLLSDVVREDRGLS
jgi:hypothetical protein